MSQTLAHRNITIHRRVNFLAGVTFTMPVIALLYTYAGLSLAQIVLLSNMSTMVMRLLELPTSVFADTTGRKQSLTIAVVCNACAALVMFLFPSRWWFMVATVFSSLYYTFRSGTGQAFLEENLRIVWEEKHFARHMGILMSMEKIPWLVLPWIATWVLYLWADNGWTILLGLDVLSAIALLVLVLQYRDVSTPKPFASFTDLMRQNLAVARMSVSAVFSSPSLRILVLFRSLSNHVSFLPLLILPYLQSNGMLESQGWVVMGIIGAVSIVAVKYSYLIGEKIGYARAWILSSVMQAILLVVIGLIGGVSWRIIALVFGLFTIWDKG